MLVYLRFHLVCNGRIPLRIHLSLPESNRFADMSLKAINV